MTYIKSTLIAAVAFSGLLAADASAMPVEKLQGIGPDHGAAEQVRLRYRSAHRGRYLGGSRYIRETPNAQHPFAGYGRPDSW